MRPRLDRVLGLSAVAASALLVATAALADVDPQKRAAAEALFDAAKDLSAQHKYAEACPKLLESYNLDPAIGTKFYLAECYEQTGKLASAWSFYLEVADEAHKQGSQDREKFARDRAAALKPRLPKLAVSVPATARVAGLAVKRDGVAVGEGAWDAPIPVDLGDHVITATAPGRKAWEGHAEAKEDGAMLHVEVPALELLPPAFAPVVEPPPPPEPPPTPRWATGQGVAGIVVAGIGVAALAGGTGAGVVAMSKQSASNSTGNCVASTDTCSPAGHALRVDAIHAATASTALFVVGGVAVAGGGILLLTAPSGKKPLDAPRPGQPRVGIVLGPGSVSLFGHM